jgi:hypothetical protein
MDDRRRRIGEHAATSNIPWAVSVLGPVPFEPAARLAWQDKAAAVGAYRELSGHDHPGDPIGPEPSANNPDLRAAWHAARNVLTPDGTPEVRTTEESQLSDLANMSRQIEELSARRRELIAGLAERQHRHVPMEYSGPLASSSLDVLLGAGQYRTAILQPPKPEMIPSPRILERAAERDRDWEAAE